MNEIGNIYKSVFYTKRTSNRELHVLQLVTLLTESNPRSYRPYLCRISRHLVTCVRSRIESDQSEKKEGERFGTGGMID